MIKLNDKYAIKSDENQWILCEWKGKPKKGGCGDGWRQIKFYSSIKQLVEGTATLLLRKSQYSSFQELLSNQRAIVEMVEDKLKGL
jgi:hypothetical protein